MNLKQFKAKLQALSTEAPTEFNSNNGWGFGGAYGTRYHIHGIVVTVAKACYRHTGTTPFVRIDIEGNYGALDEIQKPKVFDRAIEFIEKHLEKSK